MGIVKTPDKFRFTLQWGAETSEKVQAGNFLESLGNRKSEFIVLAVHEYLAAHPEALTAGRKLQIVVNPSVTPEQVKAMITTMLEEKLAGMALAAQEPNSSGSKLVVTETDVNEMLENLNLFSP